MQCSAEYFDTRQRKNYEDGENCMGRSIIIVYSSSSIVRVMENGV